MDGRNRCPASDRRIITAGKHSKAERGDSDELVVKVRYGSRRTGSSGNSSNCSNNLSCEVVDRYIDGEQHQEKKRTNHNFLRIPTGKECASRPPSRTSVTAGSSPTDSSKSKPQSHPLREAKGARTHFSRRDWMETGLGHESPRSVARNVIDKLAQTSFFPRALSEEFDCNIPITVEDSYGGSMDKDSYSDAAMQIFTSLDEPIEEMNKIHKEEVLGIHQENIFPVNNYDPPCSVELDEQIDFELQRKHQKAKERVAFLLEELENAHSLAATNFDVPTLIHTIRNLREERMNLALEVAELLQLTIVERASIKEELRRAKPEQECQTQRLEKEKELQYDLEKELDRRSSDWSSELEKYQSEEQRLRERIRELAEQNVSLQREVSSFSKREAESRSSLACSELQLKELMATMEELSQKNEELHQNVSELKEKYRAAEENENCFKRNFHEKEKECRELHRSVTRLLRTNNEQEKTIEGLREGLLEDVKKLQSLEIIDKHVAKLQMEQVRLIGVEVALRKEVESCRLEINRLRGGNINLLSQLKGNEKVTEDLTFELEKEMRACVCCLQTRVLSLLNESTNLCTELLEFIRKPNHQDATFTKTALDGQFILDCDVKVQGFKHGTKSLTRSLRTMSWVLHEKSRPSLSFDVGSMQSDNPSSQDTLRSELKAEKLVTSLLREKLYSKDLEIEQLQAEIATAVRGTDILRNEVQNALDNHSCVLHKMKDLELQMLKKDENMRGLQDDLQDSKKQLTFMKNILPKITQERDSMWDEVKQYSQQKMILNSEVDMLKKKIKTLYEDVLSKEGQITSLKDSLEQRPFNLLDSPDFI